MKTICTFKTFLYLSFIVLAVSCSKEDKDEFNPENLESIQFEREEIINTLPEGLKNSQDEYAQDAVSWIESATDWSTFADQLTPPEDAVKYGARSAAAASDAYTWSWSSGAYSMSMLWEYYEDAAKKYWDISIKYNTDVWSKYIEAWESKTGIKGEIKYNFQWVCAYAGDDSECPEYFWKYTWEKDASNSYKFNFIVESTDETYNSTSNYEVLVRENGSGYVDYYLYDQLFYHIEWDEAGNGSWTYYFGSSEETGSWTVD